MWAEENPLILAQLVRESLEDKQKDDVVLSPLHEQARFAFDSYRRKLETMVTEELKAEIRSVNQRLSLSPANLEKSALKLGGRREELVERLLSEALRTLTVTTAAKTGAGALQPPTANSVVTLDDSSEGEGGSGSEDEDSDSDSDFEFLPDPKKAPTQASSSSSSSFRGHLQLPTPEEALR